jgi:hypothetical protein
MVIEPRRTPWQTGPVATPSVRGKPPVSAGSLLGVVWKLALLAGLGVGGYYIYQYAPTVWSRVRLNSDVESASVFFMRQIPRQEPSEKDLQRAISVAVDDKLKTYLAYRARWYVAYGQRGDDLKVVRNDEFVAQDQVFFSKSVELARKSLEVPGTELQQLSFPRGSLTRAVTIDGNTWYVVAGWSEEGK